MEQPIRKRIVINLDPRADQHIVHQRAPAPNGARRIWPKIILFIAAFCVLLVMLSSLGLFLWWRNFQTTPAYSLALMIDAAQRDDTEAFARQVDDEALAKNMIASLSDKAAAQYGLALSSSMRTQIEKLLPSLLPQLKQTVHREIAREVKEFAGKAEDKPFIIIAMAVARLANITTDGKTAEATATVRDRKVELAMHFDGEQWKVVDFKDDVLTQRIVDGVMKDLPSIGGIELGNIVKPRKQPAVTANQSH